MQPIVVRAVLWDMYIVQADIAMMTNFRYTVQPYYVFYFLDVSFLETGVRIRDRVDNGPEK